MSRNSLAAIAATVVVVIVVALGFDVLGGPGTQRLVQSDLRIVRSLAELAQQINFKWNNSGKVLPRTLDNLTGSAKQNPITHELFLYHPMSNSEYELCATFATDIAMPRCRIRTTSGRTRKGNTALRWTLPSQCRRLRTFIEGADGKGTVYVNLKDKSEVVAVDSGSLKIKSRWPVAPAGGPTALAMDVQHFAGTGYLFFSGVTNFGDWAAVIAGLHQLANLPHIKLGLRITSE